VFDSEGSFAIAVMWKDGGSISLLKDRIQPTCVFDLTKELNTIFFASTKYIFEEAMKATFKSFPKFKATEINPHTIYTVSEGNIKLLKAINTSDKKEYPTESVYVGEEFLTNRIENRVRRLFLDAFGYKNYIPFMRKFASEYYGETSNCMERSMENSITIAEAWITKKFELYGEDLCDISTFGESYNNFYRMVK
jgi:hypothetical protein